jgi:hypothetical protein
VWAEHRTVLSFELDEITRPSAAVRTSNATRPAAVFTRLAWIANLANHRHNTHVFKYRPSPEPSVQPRPSFGPWRRVGPQ